MGRGSYTASDWSNLRKKEGLNGTSRVESIFKNSSASDYYNCRFIKMRESCDSEDSPESVPIILGFDVTGSMEFLAKELAINSISKTVIDLHQNDIVKSPQIMCAAIGDCKSDKYPLQVTQFETDIRINKQLLNLHLECGGGGNNGESYNLLWYFAAMHTKTDAYEKRKKKGIIITMGDDICHPVLSVAEIKRVFNDDIPYSLSNDELIRTVSEKYDVFHINIERGSASDKAVFDYWRRVLKGHATFISSKNIQYINSLITSIIAVNYGKNFNSVLKSIDQSVAEKIAESLALIEIKEETENNTITF